MNLQSWSPICKAIGYAAGVNYVVRRGLMRRGMMNRAEARVKPSGIMTPISLRSLPSSDMDAFEQVFIEREYEAAVQITEPRLIVDLGANIGLSSLYFVRQFPDAEIIAVEPDPRNFAMLQKNTAAYPGITPVLGAIWHSPRQLQLCPAAYKDRREWATQVVEGDEGGVEAFDIPSLVGTRVIDLLKIDIERAEIPLFSQNTSWLRQVKNLCIELHDQECIDTFQRAMQRFDYQLSRSGELTICHSIQQKMAKAAAS